MPTPVYVGQVSTQDHSGSNRTSLATPVFNLVAGNMVSVVIRVGTPITGVTDLAGNTYTADGGDSQMQIWSAANCLPHAANVVTATFQANPYVNITAAQFSGVHLTTHFDAYNTGTASGVTSVSCSPIGTQADQLVVVAASIGAAGNPTFPAGFTVVYNGGSHSVAYGVNTTKYYDGTKTITATFSGTQAKTIGASIYNAQNLGTTESRISQLNAEILTSGAVGGGSVRVSQLIAELLRPNVVPTLLVPPARAGTSSSGKTSGAANSLTIAHTATGDPLMVYCVVWQNNATAITYGGVALTRGGRQTSGNMRAEWWFLAHPTIGLANIVITLPNTWVAAENHNVANTVTEASDLAQLVVTSAQGSGTAPSIGITSRSGDLVIDIVGGFGNNTTFTPGAGQTKIHGHDSIPGTDVKTASSEEAGAPTVTMSWALSVSSDLSILAINYPEVSSLPAARITQHLVEVVVLPTAPSQITQMVVEVLSLPPAPARVSQMVVETLTIPSPPGRVTQLAMELLMPSPPTGENTSLWID